MPFTAIGNFQLLSQLYKYKEYRIGCTFKVLPTPLTVMDREPTNDYNWMDPRLWRIVESALWEQLKKLRNWEDAKKLRANLVVYHINIHIRATETPHPAMQSLLSSLEMTADLCLNVQLDHITCEDRISLRTRDTASESNDNTTATTTTTGNGLAVMPTAEPPSNVPSCASTPKYKHDYNWKLFQPIVKVKRMRAHFFQNGGVANNGGSSGQTTNRPSRSLYRTRSLVESKRSTSNVLANGSKNSAGAGLNGKSVLQEKSSNSKPIYVQDSDDGDNVKDDDDDDDDWLPSTAKGQSKTKIKRGRRSSSQGVDKSKTLVDSKATRRFFQVPKENYDYKLQKVLVSSLIKKLDEKPSTSFQAKHRSESSLIATPEKAPKEEQTDGVLAEAPPLARVLRLEFVTFAHVLDTFKRYESNFDELFNERKYYKETPNYMGLTPIDVMDMLNANIRDKMLQLLVKKYYSHTNHTSMIINGLLSLWIVLLFREAYNLNHEAAVRQIKYQKKWSRYLKSLENDPLNFDPEDD